VAGGHGDAAAGAEMMDGEVHDRCGADPQVQHPDAGGPQAVDEPGGILGAAQAPVAAHHDVRPAAAPQVGAGGAADGGRQLRRQFLADDAADVVTLEHVGNGNLHGALRGQAQRPCFFSIMVSTSSGTRSFMDPPRAYTSLTRRELRKEYLNAGTRNRVSISGASLRFIRAIWSSYS